MPLTVIHPNRRLVVRTAEGQDGICSVRAETSFPSEIVTAAGIVARLVRVTDRYVLYQEIASTAA